MNEGWDGVREGACCLTCLPLDGWLGILLVLCSAGAILLPPNVHGSSEAEP
jgi:hypothetical protein